MTLTPGQTATVELIDLWARSEFAGAIPGLVPTPAALPVGTRWQMCLRHSASLLVALTVSPDDRFVAAGGQDGVVRVWNREDKTLATVLPGHESGCRSLDWNPRTNVIVSGSVEGRLRFWQMPQGRLIRTVDTGHRGIIDGCFSPNGNFLASTSWENRGFLWTAAGKQLRELSGHKNRRHPCCMEPRQPSRDVTRIARSGTSLGR